MHQLAHYGHCRLSLPSYLRHNIHHQWKQRSTKDYDVTKLSLGTSVYMYLPGLQMLSWLCHEQTQTYLHSSQAVLSRQPPLCARTLMALPSPLQATPLKSPTLEWTLCTKSRI